MKHWTDINIWRILKILCIVFCMIFMLAACGSDSDEATLGPRGKDKVQTIEAQRDCIQASLLNTMYGGLGKMAANVYNELTSEDLLSLLILVFSIWMAYQILRHVSATVPESLGEFWTKVLQKATLCAACGILASSTDNIYYTVNTFVLPVYLTLLEFASTVLQLLGNQPGANTTEIVITGDVATDIGGTLTEPITHKMSDSGCILASTGNIKWSGEEFPPEPANMMSCMACAISDRLNVGYSISMLMMKSGNIFAFIVAIFLFLSFTIVKWGFALYLIDSIFRFTMMIIMMPFLILFFPFEQTRKWTTVGFQVILNSAAILLCLAMLIGMTVYAMESMFNNPDIGDFGSKNTYENFNLISLSLVFMGFVVITAAGLAVSLSESITGGGGEARANKNATAVLGTLGNGLLLLASMGASSVLQAAAAHSKRVRTMIEKVQKAQAKVNQVKQRMNQLAGREKQNQNNAPAAEGAVEAGGEE